jgi:hypothetical protein
MPCLTLHRPRHSHRAAAPLQLPADYTIEGALRDFYNSASWGVVFKDLPRLASRVVVRASEFCREHTLLFPPQSLSSSSLKGESSTAATDSADASQQQQQQQQQQQPQEPKRSSLICLSNIDETARIQALTLERERIRRQNLRTLCEVVWDIAQFLEDEETALKIHPQLQQLVLASSHETDDLQFITKQILEEIIGMSSRTARVVRMINQAVILEGMIVLRSSCQRSGVLQYCRDLHESRGWQVQVRLSPTAVSIAHCRQERCGNPLLGEAGNFECGWRLQVMFDGAMQDMLSADIRFTNIKFGEQTPETLRRTVNNALCNGSLIVA